jgi:hypothetical protein
MLSTKKRKSEVITFPVSIFETADKLFTCVSIYNVLKVKRRILG